MRYYNDTDIHKQINICKSQKVLSHLKIVSSYNLVIPGEIAFEEIDLRVREYDCACVCDRERVGVRLRWCKLFRFC